MLTWLGIITIVIFMALILAKRLHVITALILVPIAAGVVGGFSSELGKMMLAGVKTVSTTGIMILFSVMFFGCLLDTGLFNPMIFKILRMVKNDPLKIAVGTAIITLLVAFDGDGTTTFMIITLAMLPIYTKARMNPLVLTCITSLAFYLMNASPWGGPTTRTMAVLQLGVEEVFVPMLPALVIGAVWIIFVAYIIGRQERKRLGYVETENINVSANLEAAEALEQQDPALLRPHLIWVNFALLVIAMVALVKSWIPSAVLFIIAFALVILINYRSFDEMEERIRAHAGNALWATVMIFAAGIFTGIFKETKMIDALATSMVAVIPEALGPHMAVITTVTSYLSTLVLSPDAFYFGFLPIISQAAVHFGLAPVEIGRAALFGQLGYGISPMVGAPLLLCSLAKVQFMDHQRFTFIWGFLTTLVMMLAGLITGAMSL